MEGALRPQSGDPASARGESKIVESLTPDCGRGRPPSGPSFPRSRMPNSRFRTCRPSRAVSCASMRSARCISAAPSDDGDHWLQACAASHVHRRNRTAGRQPHRHSQRIPRSRAVGLRALSAHPVCLGQGPGLHRLPGGAVRRPAALGHTGHGGGSECVAHGSDSQDCAGLTRRMGFAARLGKNSHRSPSRRRQFSICCALLWSASKNLRPHPELPTGGADPLRMKSSKITFSAYHAENVIFAFILGAPPAQAPCGSTAVTGRVSKDGRHTRRLHRRTGAEPAFSALWRRPSVSRVLRDASRVAAVHSTTVRAGPLLRMRAEIVADALLRDSSCTSLTLRRLFYVISARLNSCPVSQRNPSRALRTVPPMMGFAALNPSCKSAISSPCFDLPELVYFQDEE
jgi:hypothetical protein